MESALPVVKYLGALVLFSATMSNVVTGPVVPWLYLPRCLLRVRRYIGEVQVQRAELKNLETTRRNKENMLEKVKENHMSRVDELARLKERVRGCVRACVGVCVGVCGL